MNTQSCLASLSWVTKETLQLHIKSVEKQLSEGIKKDVQTFSYKVKDSRQCVWHVFLPLGSPSIPWNICLNFRSSRSLLLVSEKRFFWSCLTHYDHTDGNHVSLCRCTPASQLGISGWAFLALPGWLSYTSKSFLMDFVFWMFENGHRHTGWPFAGNT